MMRNNEMQTDRAIEGAHARMAQAWQWLCEQRSTAPDSADVWHIRWEKLNRGEGWLTALTHQLLRGEYRLTPLQLQGQNENRKAVWSAQDALVLKWVALRLQHQLPLHPSCEHVTGHGGGKQSIEKLHHLLTGNTDAHEKKTDDSNTRGYTWGCRTDIRGYYRNINKQTLIGQVQQHVQNPVLRDLVHQYIHYTVEDGGTFHTPDKGISRGCPLSPLMGALHLYDMDEHFSQQPNIHYARYMDDIIILANTRWQLRKHTKRLMQWFSEYGFEAHPDKTQIGRTEKGFDWMGAWLTSDGVTDIAPRAKANHREKVRRLYEQLARSPMWKRKRVAPQVHARVSTYRKRWNIWAGGVLVAAFAQSSHADRPIIVLSPTLPLGVILPGGDFVTNLAVPPSVSTNAVQGTSAINLTGVYTGTLTTLGGTEGGVKWGAAVSGGAFGGSFGVQILARGDLYLIPTQGYIALTDDRGNRWAVDLDAKSQTLCGGSIKTTGPGGAKVSAVSMDMGYTCRMVGTAQKGTILGQDAAVTWTPVTGTGAVSAGATNITGLYVGDNPHSTAAPLEKPTNIVVAGMSCTFDTPPLIEMGKVSATVTPGRSVSASTGLSTGLKASCQGSNTTSLDIPIGYTLAPSAGGIAEAKTKLTYTNQPSFYMVFTSDGSSTCDATYAKAIPLDGATSTTIATVRPGQTMTATPVPLGATLCTTGITTQPPGPYAMYVTASIVSY